MAAGGVPPQHHRGHRRRRQHVLSDVVVTYDYDAFGRLHRIHSANGSVVTYSWGDDDLLAEETVVGDPGGGVARLLKRTRYIYDERGRLIRKSRSSFRDDPAAAVDVEMQNTYDGDNNRVGVIDALGATTTYVHDALGRLAEAIDPVGNRSRRARSARSSCATRRWPGARASCTMRASLGGGSSCGAPSTATSKRGNERWC